MKKSLFMIAATLVIGFGQAVVAQTEKTLEVTRSGFEPKTVEIDKGTKVNFDNKLRTKITLTCRKSDGAPFNAEIEQGQTGNISFSDTGEHLCRFWAGDKEFTAGTINVKCGPVDNGRTLPVKFEIGELPNNVDVRLGEKIEFKNAGESPLGIRATDGSFDSGELKPGATYVFSPGKTTEIEAVAYQGEKTGARMRIRVICQ